MRRKLDARLDDEVRLHLDELAAEYMRRGATPDQARRAARRAFGGVEQMKEQHRDGRGFRWVEDAWRDMRYAVRMLRRDRALASIAVITLALGIGANTALFSVIDALMLRRLPVTKPDELRFSRSPARPRFRASAFPIRSTRTFRPRRMPSRVSSRVRERQPDAGGHGRGWQRNRSRPRPGSVRQLLLGPQPRLPPPVACWSRADDDVDRTCRRCRRSATGSGLDASDVTPVSSAAGSRSTTFRSRLWASRPLVSTASRSAPIRTSGGPLV